LDGVVRNWRAAATERWGGGYFDGARDEDVGGELEDESLTRLPLHLHHRLLLQKIEI
jgi:hypothetical protein